jgi:hypothetical protein
MKLHVVIALIGLAFAAFVAADDTDACETCCAVYHNGGEWQDFWEDTGCNDDCTTDACPEPEATPEARSGLSDSVVNHMMYEMMSQQGASPQMLSMVANMGQGLSAKEFMKINMISQMGLQPELVHLLLNGGKFDSDEDKNKNAMINYLASTGSIPSTLVPFLVKADGAKEFFIFSMMESGAINPMMGLLALSNTNSNFDKDAILELITQSALHGDTDDLFQGITTPYIPILPQGIFPGSQLTFAHFEGLNINTCALHDLRNRFECGYTGISAADCEYAPYCCYSPVFMTDKQVQESTEGAIVSASAVPWCYYNIFFVYYDQFYLEVKQIGEFPAPIQCPSFWKYGLNIDDSMVSLVSGNAAFAKLTNEREECGFPGITEFQCVAIRGCCWDENVPYGQSQCFKANEIPKFSPSDIPDAYKPVIGMCDVNRFQIPMLYYMRTAATYPLKHHKVGGYNIFQEPSREDCLTKLGQCYEDDEAIVAKYPSIPRCYQRTTDGTTSPVAPILSLIRSGDSDEKFPGFPAAEPETTTTA